MSRKCHVLFLLLNVNFNDLLTNDIVSFEQLGPGVSQHRENFRNNEHAENVKNHPLRYLPCPFLHNLWSFLLWG